MNPIKKILPEEEEELTEKSYNNLKEGVIKLHEKFDRGREHLHERFEKGKQQFHGKGNRFRLRRLM
jgi:hypothetical protein